MKCCILLLLVTSCGNETGPQTLKPATGGTRSWLVTAADIDTIIERSYTYGAINASYLPVVKDTLLPQKLVAYAKTLVNTCYNFGCSTPSAGFDCSGFITYVFSHFGITVPRSSVDFKNEGTAVELALSKPGDVILFTGTTGKAIGHIGLIISNDTSGIFFIHSSSGTACGVIITKLNDYYMSRFVKVRQICP